jgi:ABC-2 type transport system permease protein
MVADIGIPRALKIYPALMRAYWARALIYRAVFAVSIMTAMFPLVMMSIWIAMAQTGPIAGYGPADFAGYYLAAILVRRITGCAIAPDVEHLVRSGELSAYLVRPLGVAHFLFARVLTSRFMSVGIVAVPVAAAAWLIPGAQFEASPLTLALFSAACALGLLFEFLAQYLIGSLSFWIVQAHGVNAAFTFVKLFFGGYIVPLALFPAGLQAAVRWLPFQIAVGLPVEILTGAAPADQAVLRMAVCAVWIAFLAAAARAVWRAGLRSYGAVGA